MNWTGISQDPEPLEMRALMRYRLWKYRIATLEHVRLVCEDGGYWSKNMRPWVVGSKKLRSRRSPERALVDVRIDTLIGSSSFYTLVDSTYYEEVRDSSQIFEWELNRAIDREDPDMAFATLLRDTMVAAGITEFTTTSGHLLRLVARADWMERNAHE